MSTDPRTRYAGPEQQNPVEQQHPGQSDAMEPEPDYGESTYRGSGKLTGRRALITGGDSGIGGAVALAFAREGADVMISHLAAEENDARETCRLVSEAGRKAASLAGPVRPGHEDQRLRDVLPLQGRNAAPVRRLRDHQHDLRPGLRTIAEPARLRDQQGSHPQLHQGIGPGARAQGHPRQRRRARSDLDTPHPGNHACGEDRRVRRRHSLGRAGQPAELAPAYVFLASGDSTYITGERIGATGGRPLP